MTKICIFTPVPLKSVGGGERILSIIANKLAEKCDLTIVSYDASNPFFCISDDVRLLSLGLKKSKNYYVRKLQPILFFYRFRKLVKEQKFQKIIAFSDVGSIFVFFSLLFMTKIEKISWLHNSFFEPQHVIIDILRRFALKRFSTVIVLNRIDYYIYSRLLKKVQIRLIPNPLTFLETDNSVSSLTEKRLISVGRLNKLKGFDSLIEIVSPLLRKYPDWSFDIYGQDDGVKEDLLKLIHTNGMDNQIFIHEPVKDIKAKYLKSSIFVFASYFESFGLVLLEAGRMGLPVVAYAAPSGVPDIIHDGINGFLVDDRNVEEFSNSLENLMQNQFLRTQMGKAAYECTKKYEISSVMRKWEFLYK